MIVQAGRRGRRRWPWVLLGLVVVAGGAGAAWFLLLREPATIEVRVGSEAREVDRGTTFATAAERFGLAPRAGDLLDVEGGVLEAGAYPGRLLLNGAAAPGTTVLANGDRMAVEDGEDRTEGTVREVAHVEAGPPSNPQFFLETTPGEQTVVRGEVSKKLVSAEFRPTEEPRRSRAVALTFDDGPWPGSTARILEVLDRLQARATFFVIGNLAERYPELVRRELTAGMAVASHSYEHPNSPRFARLGHARIREEIERGKQALETLGAEPAAFRPPGGSYSDFVVRAAEANGLRVVLWSVDPRDWEAGTTAKQLVTRVLDSVQPGSIVVLHDGGGDRSATIEALPKIIRGIRKKGLELAVIE